MKQYAKQQEEIKHIKDFIASCGTYANLVRQAKSRQKVCSVKVQHVRFDGSYNARVVRG
jgi:ATP-binding cassette subfamily F protein 2